MRDRAQGFAFICGRTVFNFNKDLSPVVKAFEEEEKSEPSDFLLDTLQDLIEATEYDLLETSFSYEEILSALLVELKELVSHKH